MDIISKIKSHAQEALAELYQLETNDLDIQPTRKEFEGDFTLVVFPFLKNSRKNPVETGKEIGEFLKEKVEEIEDYNVIKGFLNLSLSNSYWVSELKNISKTENFGIQKKGNEKIVVEYSSPNTNKPLHLGHVRNILLGFSVSQILEAAGKEVIKVQIINDRGIHICKSMLAWQKFGDGESPENSTLKGDHLVGKYYVKFDQEYRKEIEQLVEAGHDAEKAKKEAPILKEAQEMLQKWENNDEGVRALWKKMNNWVYDGFYKTYLKLGVDFDKDYYESNTYILGKENVEKGLEKGVFFQKEGGSVWVDLTDDGLDEKLLLRADGTSVYMTQDIGTAIQRFVDFKMNGMVYTVGNEQDYHFKVLFLILKKLGYDWADNLHHLSYGMVDLPTGKMKSREGTVVDADDLITEMEETAANISEELGKTEGMSEQQKQALFHMVGMGALKYYILRVLPHKGMLFNPEESVDFQGNTGSFIQYTHARIKSLLRKAEETDLPKSDEKYTDLQPIEKEVLKKLTQFPEIVTQAAEDLSPSSVANYVYDLVKSFNAFYQQVPILTDENAAAVQFRLQLSEEVAGVVKTAMGLLGIDVPERM